MLTGAGVSSSSGIPTYRDDKGVWQRGDPIQHADFIRSHATRQRYWARSALGWQFMAGARPNPAHYSLARLEQAGYVQLLVTQNVDRLHQQAGHCNVVDLHGRLDRVVCLHCTRKQSRAGLQEALLNLNPMLANSVAEVRPDGDADIAESYVGNFVVPSCSFCGGVLMPDVVFFGGYVPRDRVDRTAAVLEQVDGLLAAGSSLMVYSGFRFCRLAKQLGKPLAILNRGATRADDLADLKISADCGAELSKLCTALELPPAGEL